MVDQNEFFRDVTLKICGNLEIEEGLRDCFRYISQYITSHALYLKRHKTELGAMRGVARATAQKAEKMDLPITLPEQAKSAMMEVAETWKAGMLPPVLVINSPTEEPVTKCLLEALDEPISSAMSLPLLVEDQIVGALAQKRYKSGRVQGLTVMPLKIKN